MIETLRSPKTTNRTPPGRRSWNDAMNQVEGNLEWMLSFLNGEEIIAKITEIESRKSRDIKSVSKRYRFLKNLEDYYKENLQESRREIDWMQENADASDLDTSTDLEEWIQSE